MGEVLSFKRIQIVVIAAIAAVALGCSLSLGAQSAFAVGTTFEAGEGDSAAKYTITSMDPLEVDYTQTMATGDAIVIPAKVKYEGKTYAVTSVGKQACRGFEGKTITTGKNLKTIGNGAFRDCPNLETVNIGNSVVKIGLRVCKNDPKLVNINIGKNVKTIGFLALKNDKKCEEVTINSAKLTAKGVKDVFKKSNVKTVKVPASKVEDYKKIFTKKNCGKAVDVVAI